MTVTIDSSFVSIKECARILGYNPNHIRKLVQESKIPAVRLKNDCRNSWRIDLNQIPFETNTPETVTIKKSKIQQQTEKQEVEDIIAYIDSL